MSHDHVTLDPLLLGTSGLAMDDAVNQRVAAWERQSSADKGEGTNL